jgi:hypothetical protein
MPYSICLYLPGPTRDDELEADQAEVLFGGSASLPDSSRDPFTLSRKRGGGERGDGTQFRGLQ